MPVCSLPLLEALFKFACHLKCMIMCCNKVRSGKGKLGLDRS